VQGDNAHDNYAFNLYIVLMDVVHDLYLHATPKVCEFHLQLVETSAIELSEQSSVDQSFCKHIIMHHL
jgi:hypothetical protein